MYGRLMQGLFKGFAVAGEFRELLKLSDSHLPIFFLASICRQKQSPRQIGALILLVFAAILLSIGESSGRGSSGGNSDRVLMYGIVPILFASVLSGLASSLCQWASQVRSLFFVILNKALKSVPVLNLMASI